MSQKRLINCGFINNGAFAKISNKAKLLYIYIFTNADHKGFCDNASLIIDQLNNAETDSGNSLIENNYRVALQELVDKELLFKFVGKHNTIYLVRHWYYHNVYRKDLHTNYYKLLKQVVLEEDKYEWKPVEKETIKENKVVESKVVESKVNIEEEKEEEVKVYGENEMNPNDYPFDLDDYKGKGE